MIFPRLARFTDVALPLLRVMVGLVFITSGWKHLKDPEARSKDIGMSKGFTVFLGAAQVAGSLGVIFGVLTQLAAAGLILIMLAAIQKKIFVWLTGFWGESGTNGWSYDTMLSNESSDRHYRRWKPLSDEMIHDVRDAYEFKNEATKVDESKCGGRDEMKKTRALLLTKQISPG